MTEQKLYKIQYRDTMGFGLINENATNLTKEQCDKMLQSLIFEGNNPNDLRAVLVNDPRFPD
jgi:hypothetical protein|tara:strand:- start:209 stop:394 length:186 start_codon:yes stop_codon:yes gene_type:complete